MTLPQPCVLLKSCLVDYAQNLLLGEADGLCCHHFVPSGTHLGVALYLSVRPAQNFPTGYIPALALQGPTVGDLALALEGSEHLLHAARAIRAEATEVGGVLSHRGALSLPHPLGKLLGVI